MLFRVLWLFFVLLACFPPVRSISWGIWTGICVGVWRQYLEGKVYASEMISCSKWHHQTDKKIVFPGYMRCWSFEDIVSSNSTDFVVLRKSDGSCLALFFYFELDVWINCGLFVGFSDLLWSWDNSTRVQLGGLASLKIKSSLYEENIMPKLYFAQWLSSALNSVTGVDVLAKILLVHIFSSDIKLRRNSYSTWSTWRF